MIKILEFSVNKHEETGVSFESDSAAFLESADKLIVKFEAKVDKKFLEKFKQLIDKELGLNKKEKGKKD